MQKTLTQGKEDICKGKEDICIYCGGSLSVATKEDFHNYYKLRKGYYPKSQDYLRCRSCKKMQCRIR